MNQTELLYSRLEQVEGRSLVIGICALSALAIGAILDPKQFFQAYLLGYLFWIGIALGCLGILMLHNLTGGEWGVPIRAMLESAIQTFPLMVVLFLPFYLGLEHCFGRKPDMFAHPDFSFWIS